MTKHSFLWITMVITLCVSLLYVRSRFFVVELSLSISQVQKQKQTLEQEKRTLALELARLQNPGRVEAIADQKLQLTRQHDPIVIQMSERGLPQ